MKVEMVIGERSVQGGYFDYEFAEGVYWKPKPRAGYNPLIDEWLCDSLEIAAVTRDEHGNWWGRLLRWDNPDGEEFLWVMSASIPYCQPKRLRRALLSTGLKVSTNGRGRRLLCQYVSSIPMNLPWIRSVPWALPLRSNHEKAQDVLRQIDKANGSVP